MIKNFFNVAGADAVKRIAEWIKQKFYTKSEIDDMLSAGMKYKVVNELPATGEAGTVYLVPKQSAGTGDVYDEYIYVDGSFEHIGSTEIDLSNYYTKAQADDLLDDKVDKVSGKGLSTEDYTTAEKTKLGGIETGAEVNVQSDWNQSDSTKDDYIKNKPTLRQPSTDGTAGQYLKSNGSGNAPSWETMDSSPTANSTKAVTSGGVKTALDGKQASISITANANTPTDNDTVIMQDNGNTGTTSFLRRKLSTLWTYIKGKADEFYFARYDFANFPNDSFLEQKRYFQFFDDRLWGADQRFNVTWNTYDSETHENLNYTHTVANLFNHNFDNYLAHPQTGEYDVIRIYPKTEGGTLGWSYGTGWLFIFFYYISYPEVSPIVRIYGGRSGQKSWTTLPEPTKVTAQVFKYSLSQQDPALYLEEIEITITGKTFPNESSAKGCGVSNICYIPNRAPIADSAIVTKYGVTQSFYGNIVAPKFQTRGGTSSQYLRGDGSLTALSTTPTSGSTIPITSGGVYTNTQSKLSINIPDNNGYRVMHLIADVTDSFNAPNYNIVGLTGYIYQWRYGATGTIPHRITAIGAHDASQVWLYTDCDLETRALLPYLIKYNGRYYIALKKNSSSRSGIRLIGYWNGLLSEPINLYANSTASKWYSDSERTQEITFEITKSYERYPNAYLNFGGTTSQVVTGTGELKTIDSSVASGSSNLVTSGAVATAINGIDTSGKVNLQPDFTASQIDYSAGNVGKWQKVLRFPEGADLVINMKKTAMGSDATSTLWFSSSTMGDSYTSLFGNHSVRFVHDGGYVFLVLACRKSTYEPIESYTFQIAHSSVPMSDIVAVTDASPITATPKEPNIVYRAPMTTGAVSFNVNSSGAGSVSMSGHNDFLGNMTSEATNGVTVTMSGATEGQIYRFVFTRNITGGVTFKQSNVAYCTISGDVNAGDTITLTAVSNTADGWLYEQESAGIESSDGSNIIKYNGSTADVRVNWDKLPARVVMNVAEDDYEDDKNIAIGYEASTYKLTGDDEYPYAYTTKATFEKMKVDGGEEEYAHAVTAGTTYSIVRGSVTTSFTPAHSGYAVILNTSSDVFLAQFYANIYTSTHATICTLYDATNSGDAEHHIVVINVTNTFIDRLDGDSYAMAWYKSSEKRESLALGNSTKATGKSSVALGIGSTAEDTGAVAIGYNTYARGLHSTAAGRNSQATGYLSTAYGASAYALNTQSTALGTYAQSRGAYASAFGTQATASATQSAAVGYNSNASALSSTAVGVYSKVFNDYGVVVGYSSSAGGQSVDSERPYLTAKAFSGAKFSTGGNEVYNAFVPSGGDITITIGGNSYTLTSPSASGRMLFVIYDADAPYIYRSLINPLELDGVLVDSGGTPTGENASVEHLTGNYYAVWIRYSASNPVVATQSLKFYASISRASNDNVCAVVGSYNMVMNSNCVAVGAFLYTLQSGQVILGRYNKPVEGYFIVGNGSNSSNGRKNCLVIDSNERMVINAGYVGGTQTIDMSQQTGSLSNITKAVYRIRWNDTGTVTLTLNTSGCVEGQRVTIFAETNDVKLFAQPYIIRQGRFCDFMFLGGAWRPSMGIEELVS